MHEQRAEAGVDWNEVLAPTQLRTGIGELEVLQHTALTVGERRDLVDPSGTRVLPWPARWHRRSPNHARGSGARAPLDRRRRCRRPAASPRNPRDDSSHKRFPLRAPEDTIPTTGDPSICSPAGGAWWTTRKAATAAPRLSRRRCSRRRTHARIAHKRAARAGHLPRRAAPRRQLRAGVVHGRVPSRRQAHVHRARAPARVRRARGRGHQRARTRDPEDVRDQRGRDRVHRDRLVGVLRARRGADGMARRPGEARADRRLGEHRVRFLRVRLGVGHERVHAVLDAVRDRVSPRRTASRCTSR